MIIIDRVTPARDPLAWAHDAARDLTPLMDADLLGPLYRYTSTTTEVLLIWQLPDTDAYWARRRDPRLSAWWAEQDAGPIHARHREILAPLDAQPSP